MEMNSLEEICNSAIEKQVFIDKFMFSFINVNYQYIRIDYQYKVYIGEYILNTKRLVLVGNHREEGVLNFLHFFNIKPFTYDVVIHYNKGKVNDYINGRLVSIGSYNTPIDIIIEGKRLYIDIKNQFKILSIEAYQQDPTKNLLEYAILIGVKLPPLNLEMMLIEIDVLSGKQFNDYMLVILNAFLVNTQTVVAYLPESYYVITKENVRNFTELTPEYGKWYEFVGNYFYNLTHRNIMTKSARK